MKNLEENVPLSNILLIPYKRMNKYFEIIKVFFLPVQGSFIKEKNVNNIHDRNISSFDNNIFNNNYHHQFPLFDYWKSDNKYDNSNGNNINSNSIKS